MFYKFSIVVCCLAFVAGCSSSKQTTTAKAAPKNQLQLRPLTAVADGNSREWGDTMLQFDQTLRCMYAFAGDGNNIYVLIKTSDKQQQLKIIQGGMVVWLDESGKKKETTGIKYPVGGKTMPPPTGNRSQPDIKQFKMEASQQLVYLELAGFKEGFNGKFTSNQQQPIKASINWDEKDQLIYEAAIPISALPFAAGSNSVSIGLTIKGLKLPERMGGMGGMGGMQPPAGMMPPGGGSMPNMRDIEELTRDNKARFVYQLSP